ncbi:DUF4400 domain-containing protein [Methylibium sp.]|uniref:DUF4400 domain-containing protein n=1 Tax=Methylibium sp. TaxID=2067992 RepID=UPI003D0CAD53
MIRIVAIASLMALLILVLYLPSAHPPERFVAQLRVEHGQTTRFWSAQHAENILTRTLDAQNSAGQFSPIPNLRQAPDPSRIDSAVASEMSAVNARLFNSPYFRSIDALLLLATYRCFMLLEWLPWLVAFCAAALFDGAVLRAVKAKQFAHHDPEMFALHVCAAIVVACGTVIALVLPVTLPALLLPGVPAGIAVFAAGALGNFHRRG